MFFHVLRELQGTIKKDQTAFHTVFGGKTQKLQKLKSTEKEPDANYAPDTDREGKETSGFSEQGSNIKQPQQHQKKKKSKKISDIRIKEPRQYIQCNTVKLISAEALQRPLIIMFQNGRFSDLLMFVYSHICFVLASCSYMQMPVCILRTG